jgi:prevent-host-death family protein
MRVRTIKASEFKAKCLALMDEVERTGEPVLVTKNGRPVAELRPHRPAARRGIGMLKDKIRITGDIVAPIDVKWEAEG